MATKFCRDCGHKALEHATLSMECLMHKCDCKKSSASVKQTGFFSQRTFQENMDAALGKRRIIIASHPLIGYPTDGTLI